MRLLLYADELVSAYRTEPDPHKVWVVAFCEKHPTLRTGDRVRLVADYRGSNTLVRDDYTIHPLCHGDQYVMMVPLKESSDACDPARRGADRLGL